MTTVPLNEKSKDEPSAAVKVDVPVWLAVARSTCDGPATDSLPTCVPCPLPGICSSRVVGLPPTTMGEVSMVAWKGTELPAYTTDPSESARMQAAVLMCMLLTWKPVADDIVAHQDVAEVAGR